MKEDPPVDFKCKDKFLVQSVAITAERELLAPQDLVSWALLSHSAVIYIFSFIISRARIALVL